MRRAPVRLAAVWFSCAIVLACATEVHRSSCACEIVQGPDTCRIEHEEHDFTKRPVGTRMLDALGALFGWLVP